ncbi:MAG: hypothetical protein KJN76_10555 [Eudoraea sp.]|nr:hypothetical protein [Eudoraea sp.]
MSVLILGGITATNSCKRAAEKTSEKIIEKSIGNDANVDIDDEKVVIETDEGTFTTDAKSRSWPKGVPSTIPEFKKGKIISVTTQEMDKATNWMVIFEDVPQAALQEYKEELAENGFKINYMTTAGTGGHLAAEKDKYTVVVMAGDGNATVTVGTDQ